MSWNRSEYQRVYDMLSLNRRGRRAMKSATRDKRACKRFARLITRHGF
jgi:hypothetical protein